MQSLHSLYHNDEIVCDNNAACTHTRVFKVDDIPSLSQVVVIFHLWRLRREERRGDARWDVRDVSSCGAELINQHAFELLLSISFLSFLYHIASLFNKSSKKWFTVVLWSSLSLMLKLIVSMLIYRHLFITEITQTHLIRLRNK